MVLKRSLPWRHPSARCAVAGSSLPPCGTRWKRGTRARTGSWAPAERMQSRKFCMWARGMLRVAPIISLPSGRFTFAACSESAGSGKWSHYRQARPRHLQLVVAETGIPGEQNLLGVFHGDIHGVGHFAAVFPQVDAAGHGDRFRNLQSRALYQKASWWHIFSYTLPPE